MPPQPSPRRLALSLTHHLLPSARPQGLLAGSLHVTAAYQHHLASCLHHLSCIDHPFTSSTLNPNVILFHLHPQLPNQLLEDHLGTSFSMCLPKNVSFCCWRPFTRSGPTSVSMASCLLQ